MVLVFKSHFPTLKQAGKSEALTKQVIDGILLLCTAIIIKCPYEKIASWYSLDASLLLEILKGLSEMQP